MEEQRDVRVQPRTERRSGSPIGLRSGLVLALLLGLGAGSALLSTAGARDRVAPEVARALARPGDIDSGRRSYAGCAACHGEDGRGRPDGTFPQLAGQHRSVLIKQLVDIREGLRSNPIMLPYAEALIDDQEIADVTSFIASLPPPQPLPIGGEDDALGRPLYERDCARCHGGGGEGDARRFVPVLAGQHAPYLLRQVRAIAAGRRDNAHQEMGQTVAAYSDAELRSVVAWAVTLPGPANGRAE